MAKLTLIEAAKLAEGRIVELAKTVCRLSGYAIEGDYREELLSQLRDAIAREEAKAPRKASGRNKRQGAPSKAFGGVKLPLVKRQACGHVFNSAGCAVCLTCQGERRRLACESPRTVSPDSVYFALPAFLARVAAESGERLAFNPASHAEKLAWDAEREAEAQAARDAELAATIGATFAEAA